MRGEAGRETPRTDVTPDFFHAFVAVDVDEIDRKLHEKGVYRFTGNDPEAGARRKVSASQQAFVACGTVIGKLGTTGELGLTGKIGDSEPGGWVWRRTSGGAARKPAGDAHALLLTPDLNINLLRGSFFERC